jgi:hypothetical protein
LFAIYGTAILCSGELVPKDPPVQRNPLPHIPTDTQEVKVFQGIQDCLTTLTHPNTRWLGHDMI